MQNPTQTGPQLRHIQTFDQTGDPGAEVPPRVAPEPNTKLVKMVP